MIQKIHDCLLLINNSNNIDKVKPSLRSHPPPLPLPDLKRSRISLVCIFFSYCFSTQFLSHCLLTEMSHFVFISNINIIIKCIFSCNWPLSLNMLWYFFEVFIYRHTSLFLISIEYSRVWKYHYLSLLPPF